MATLSQGESACEMLVQHSPDPLTILGSDGKVRYQSPSRCCELFGYLPEELVGRNLLDLVHPDDVASFRVAVAELESGSLQFAHLEYRFHHGSGGWIDLSSHASPAPGTQPASQILLVSRDVSEQKRSQQALRIAEARSRALLERIPAIVYSSSFAEDGAEFYVSPQIEKVLGFSQQEWAAGPRLWLSRLHPQDRMRVISEIAHSHDTGERLSSEYRLLTRSGQTIWFRDEALVVQDRSGKPTALHGVRMDISERKRAEEALRESLEERLQTEVALRRQNQALELLNRAARALGSTLDLENLLSTILEEVRNLLDVAAASIWLVDARTNELVCEQAVGANSTGLRGWRLPPGKGLGGWVVENNESLSVPDGRADERHIGDVDRETGLELRSILSAPMRASTGVIGVLQVLDTDVNRFSQAELMLLESLTASATSAVENARLYERAQNEIAERARVEEELRQERASLAQRVAERTIELSTANAELARAARLKDEFLAAMSHELRTPLNAILGLSETLEEQVYGPLNERQGDCLFSIKESGRHLLDLINDILDVAKIEAGKLELGVGPVAVESVCESSLMLVKQMARKKRLQVSFELDDSVSIVQADGRRLKQILVNLLSNACKFTPEEGSIGLIVKGDREAQVVRFDVWDTGIGISQEQMDKLFRPFVQLDSSLSRRYQGTGLGLALVRRLVELHDGHIAVKSEGVPGKGTRFTVTLPWKAGSVRPELACVPQVEAATAEPSASSVRFASGVPLVLLVDDNEINEITVRDYLEARGYRVIVARTGGEAIDRAREEKPDLILMDIQMPEMDGLEAIRRIRGDTAKAVSNIPIVALTALAMPGDRERCIEAGANEYLAKPVVLRELLGVVYSQVGQRSELTQPT